MDEFLCVTILAHPGEAETDFKKRLIAFWSIMLRQYESSYEGVYAEATHFGQQDQRATRQYFVAVEVYPVVQQALEAHGFSIAAIDLEDTYSRYEATPPDWFQIDH